MSSRWNNRRLLSALFLAVMGVPSSTYAQAPAADPAVINLICTGASFKDETVGSALDLMAGNGRTERVETANSISFAITGNAGTARLPRNMLSGYREANKDGSFNLVKVEVAENEITGQVRIHGMNKPRFRLDRLTGTVTIDGVLGDFSGRCEPYDPATVQRKF